VAEPAARGAGADDRQLARQAVAHLPRAPGDRAIVHGFQIDGFWTYAGATIIVWAVNGFVQAIAPKPDDWRRERTR
jgi:hypothetical protein